MWASEPDPHRPLVLPPVTGASPQHLCSQDRGENDSERPELMAHTGTGGWAHAELQKRACFTQKAQLLHRVAATHGRGTWRGRAGSDSGWMLPVALVPPPPTACLCRLASPTAACAHGQVSFARLNGHQEPCHRYTPSTGHQLHLPQRSTVVLTHTLCTESKPFTWWEAPHPAGSLNNVPCMALPTSAFPFPG